MKAEDSLWAGLTDAHAKIPMGITAENLAVKYGITREQCDEFGLRSQTKWAEANAAGVFNREIAPFEIKGKKGIEKMVADEHPRPSSIIGDLTKLKPVFKENGAVTAGTASGICDGAGALVVASQASVTSHNLTPLARIVSWGRVSSFILFC